MRTAACLLALTALAGRADDLHDRTSFEVEQVIDLAALKADRAISLDGRQGLFLVTIDTDTDAGESAGGVIRDCLPSSPAISASVLLPPGTEKAGEKVVVEGILDIQRLPGFIGPAAPVPPMTHLILRASRVR
jgi:hypothetical protein